MNLKTQDCYTILPPEEIGSNPLKWVVITSDDKTVVLEKRSGVIILDVEEFKKIVGDAFDAGIDRGLYSYQLDKIEYINQLIKENNI